MQSTSTISGAQVRPGRRGPGSKPRRARSIEEFSTDFETVASDRGYARLARRVRKEEKRQADKESGALDARRRELQAAVDRVHENTATEEQRELVREASDVEFFAKRYDGQQSAYDRIFGEGFVWPGGMVAGKYLRAKFVETGLRTWRHPFFQRVAASMAKASSCRFRTGPAKDRCVTQHSKLHGLDQPFGFFCDECRDMFRLDYDKTFDNEAQMRAWIAHKVQELGLTCGPHMAVWIPDDRAPGKIIRPHFLFLLPEGHAVWPRSPPDQHRLLGEVIAALTRAFECDPGGLANPFHGKIPTSPLTESVVIQDTHMPTLGEYAESMDLTYGQDLMLRKLMTERMEDAGFDKADSNTWFSAVRALSNAGGKTLFKSGADITDPEAFCSKIADLICRPVFDEIQSTASQRKTVDKLIETCTRYTAYNFDPAKMDTIGRDRGAAAHLMEDTDDARTRMQKGQAFSAGVKVRETRSAITNAIIKEMRAGTEPTISSIAAVVGKVYNTVKKHFFAAYVAAMASISIQALVKGVNPPSGQTRPTLRVLLTANMPSDLPDSWIPESGDPVLSDHFRQKSLILARQRRRKTGSMPSAESLRVPGRNVLNFLHAGQVTVYRRSAACNPPARARSQPTCCRHHAVSGGRVS